MKRIEGLIEQPIVLRQRERHRENKLALIPLGPGKEHHGYVLVRLGGNERASGPTPATDYYGTQF